MRAYEGQILSTGIFDIAFVVSVTLSFGKDHYKIFVVNVRDEALLGNIKHADLIRSQGFSAKVLSLSIKIQIKQFYLFMTRQGV